MPSGCGQDAATFEREVHRSVLGLEGAEGQLQACQAAVNPEAFSIDPVGQSGDVPIDKIKTNK